MSVVRTAAAGQVITCAIKVHRALGPGLLESAYAECLSYDLAAHKIAFRRQVPLPIVYDGHRLDCGYRLDFVIGSDLVVEVKSVERS